MENQPPQISAVNVLTPSAQVTAGTATPPTGEWPQVPPAPAPVKPPAPIATPEPPIVKTSLPEAADDSPTMIITLGAPGATGAAPEPRHPRQPQPRRPAGPAAGPVPVPPIPGSDESPIVQLQRSVRRQQMLARHPRQDLVWQPRFAYTSALVILLALTVVSMPLWIVLYRLTGSVWANEAGPAVGDLVALCMMLLGGFLAGAAAWVIIIEMRGRVRMVDTLAKSGEREVMIAPAAPEFPVLDAPLDNLMVAEPMSARAAAGDAWEPGAAPPSFAARVEAQQVSAAATLEASSKLLTSFSCVLRSFGQLPAQVAMLAVALALFVGATVLSLN